MDRLNRRVGLSAGLLSACLALLPLTPVYAQDVRRDSTSPLPPRSELLMPPEPLVPPVPEEIGAAPAVAEQMALGLPDLIGIACQRNPELRRAAFRVDAASGRALQAGLYPNPAVRVEGSELGHRAGPGGTIKAPLLSQEIVTGGKLRLSRQVGETKVDAARLAVLSQQFALYTVVRQGYFEVLAAERRVEIFSELVRLSAKATETTEILVRAREAAPLDLIQIRVESNRFRANLEAARRQRTAAWRRLAAAMGAPELPDTPLAGRLDAPWPDYDFESASCLLVQCHPDIRQTRVALGRSQLAVRRASVEWIPNVTVEAGYERGNITRQDMWTFQAGMPIPVFNRNQGNLQAANAEVGRASANVERVQNLLLRRLATAFGQYSAAGEEARLYKQSVLPDAQEAYRLSMEAYRGGQFQYLRVLQAQRAVAEANIEYVRALADLWHAASDIAGLLLEEDWPAR